MLKVVKPDPNKLDAVVHDDIIVERVSKAGETVFNIMLEQKNLDLSAGFGGGKKIAFYTTNSLVDMRETIELHNIKTDEPLIGWRIVYKETINPPENDTSYQTIPIIQFDKEGNKLITEGYNVTYEGLEVYRKTYIVPSDHPDYDVILPHDKRSK